MKKKISVVVPTYNEYENVELLVNEVNKVYAVNGSTGVLGALQS